MKPTPYVRPHGRSIKEPLWLRIAKGVLSALAMVAFGLFMAVILIEWMAGCGETYVDAKGVRHQNECVFIPHGKEKP